MSHAKPFLTAQWRFLAMANFEVEPGLIQHYVPKGTELDLNEGRCFLSVVGFLFLDTKVRGIPVPFHRSFEELNLRFYVRRKSGNEWRRGVVFLKELVPKRAIAAVARWVYNENYVAVPMRHQMEWEGSTIKKGAPVEYAWRTGDDWSRLRVTPSGDPQALEENSLEAFIMEHYWGYAAQRRGGCLEYAVEHPPWRYWPVTDTVFEADVEALYGTNFVECLSAPPHSAFLAEGSGVVVYQGIPLQ